MNIFKYLEINIFVYLFACMAILTASFIPFFIITVLIIIHELGHFIAAKAMNIEVKKIYLYPFGGISKFYLPLNTEIKKETFILAMGPIFQIIAKELLLFILPKYKEMILIYHYGILFFNLLPIYPLDGGKLLNLLLSKFIAYKKSLNISIIISYLTIIVVFLINIKNINLNLCIIVVFLIYKVTKEKRQINYFYEKFLLERYLGQYNFKKSKLIQNKDEFYRNKRHLLKIDEKYYLEKDFLAKIYKKT